MAGLHAASAVTFAKNQVKALEVREFRWVVWDARHVPYWIKPESLQVGFLDCGLQGIISPSSILGADGEWVARKLLTAAP